MTEGVTTMGEHWAEVSNTADSGQYADRIREKFPAPKDPPEHHASDAERIAASQWFVRRRINATRIENMLSVGALVIHPDYLDDQAEVQSDPSPETAISGDTAELAPEDPTAKPAETNVRPITERRRTRRTKAGKLAITQASDTDTDSQTETIAPTSIARHRSLGRHLKQA